MSKYTAEQVERIAEFHEQVRLENVERRDKLADKSADMLRDYAALLRERESARAAVTDEMLVAMGRVIANRAGEDWDNIGDFAQQTIKDTQRAALEAVAPMLANARVPEGWQLVPVEPTPEMFGAGFVAYEKAEIRKGHARWKAMLAAAPKPEKEE